MAEALRSDSIEAKAKAAGMDVLRMGHPSGSSCVATLHGGHVISFETAAHEQVLFLAARAVFSRAKAIRGGVPVIFPQFGPGKLPQHGFARTALWRVASQPTLISKGDGGKETVVTASLELTDNAETRAAWDHAFRLTLGLTLGPETLEMRLSCDNLGADSASFTAALHTYLRVADVRRSAIRGHGIRGLRFRCDPDDARDGLPAAAVRTETRDEVVLPSFTDRVYLGAPDTVELVCGGSAARVVEVSKAGGFRDCVVWNPYLERAAKMADLGDEEWPRFVCIEAATVENPAVVAPGSTWVASQTLRAVRAPRL